jgi:hypothetical protein
MYKTCTNYVYKFLPWPASGCFLAPRPRLAGCSSSTASSSSSSSSSASLALAPRAGRPRLGPLKQGIGIVWYAIANKQTNLTENKFFHCLIRGKDGLCLCLFAEHCGAPPKKILDSPLPTDSTKCPYSRHFIFQFQIKIFFFHFAPKKSKFCPILLPLHLLHKHFDK